MTLKGHRGSGFSGRLTVSALLLATLTGCAGLRLQGQGPTVNEVTLNIRAVGHEGSNDRNQWLKICAVLNRYGRVDCVNFDRTNCQQVGSVRVCDFENITLSFAPPISLDRVTRLHRELMALESEGVSLGLTYGAFGGTYTGLSAVGTVSIRVRIAVTPGATLYVEHRWPGVCEKVATPKNVFDDEITLHPGQEWIYYRSELVTGSDEVRRYFRLNISTRREEELTEKEFDRLIKRL